MPNMSEILLASQNGSGTPAPTQTEGVFADTLKIALTRDDWQRPIGYLDSIEYEPRVTEVEGTRLPWAEAHIDTLWLSHKASILLLQGLSLSRILIPSRPRTPDGVDVTPTLGHVLLRVDPWEYWHSLPRLTNLRVAYLQDVPQQLSPASVLAALAAASAA